ncbi:MAG: hypothetical protein Kow00107_06560 [Planctomycetota bacterium]
MRSLFLIAFTLGIVLSVATAEEETDLRPLIKAAQKGTPEERASAVRRLSPYISKSEVQKALAAVLRNDDDSEVLLCALDACASTEAAKLWTLVKEHLLSDDLDIRKAATRALFIQSPSKLKKELYKDAIGKKPHSAEYVRALTRIMSREEYGLLVELLRSPLSDVRAAAVAGIMKLGATDAREAAASQIESGDPVSVAQSALAALFFRDSSSVPLLIELLSDKKSSLVAHECLKSLTGRKFEADTVLWREWWKENHATWIPPDYKALGPYGEVTFFEHKVETKRIVFILDFSDSMGSGKGSSLEAQVNEVRRCVTMLPPNVEFNCVVYSRSASKYVPSAAESDAAEKERFFNWLSKWGTDTSTATFDALKISLAIRDADTLMLVGNGIPNSGELPNGRNPEVEDNVVEEVTKIVKEGNLKCRLFTVAFPFQPDLAEDTEQPLVRDENADKVRTFSKRAEGFFRLLAALNNGKYCYVDISQNKLKKAKTRE